MLHHLLAEPAHIPSHTLEAVGILLEEDLFEGHLSVEVPVTLGVEVLRLYVVVEHLPSLKAISRLSTSDVGGG